MKSYFAGSCCKKFDFFFFFFWQLAVGKCSMWLLTSCFHSHRRIITKQECCYSVMGVRQNGFPSPLSTPFLPPIPSDDQLDLNGQPAVLRDDDQHVFFFFFFVLNLENDRTMCSSQRHTNSTSHSNRSTYVSVIDYNILNVLLLDVVFFLR